MTVSWADFLSRLGRGPVQWFPCPGATRTVLFCSHIWWTDQMAFALRNLGVNVLLHVPFYVLYTDPDALPRFDSLWNDIRAVIRETHVSLIIGGNSAALLRHPATGDLLHEVAGPSPSRPIPVVNWWWDEPRTCPPVAAPPPALGPPLTPAEYLRLLNNPNTLNAVWDLDVKEELEGQYGLTNLFHLPLATLPEFWPHGYVPLEDRPLAACFLGNCHYAADWVETDDDPLVGWARDVALAKIASPETPLWALATRGHVGPAGLPPSRHVAGDDPWAGFVRPWEFVNAAYMHYTRHRFVRAAAAHLRGKLALIGRGWDRLGLRANMEHAGDKSGVIYGQSQASLNLFGGCVHGGLPLRPYDIAVSGGLILTHDQRELPSLFEDGRECLSFRTPEQMIAQIDRVRAAPREFNAVALAGRRRVLADHTWAHRLRRLLAEVDARLPHLHG